AGPGRAGAENWMEPGLTARLGPDRVVDPHETETDDAGKKPMPVKVTRLPPASGPSGVMVLRTGFMSVCRWVTRAGRTGAWAPPLIPYVTEKGKFDALWNAKRASTSAGPAGSDMAPLTAAPFTNKRLSTPPAAWNR